MAGRVETSVTGPLSTARPFCMIVTWSAISATTPMLWVTNRTPTPRTREPTDQLQDLRLHRYVECRRGLIGDDEAPDRSKRRRDDDALALAARQLMRIGPERRSGSGIPTALHQLERAGARLARDQPQMRRMVSVSWLSTVKSGLRLVIGSWKIAPTSRPGDSLGEAGATSTSLPVDGGWIRPRCGPAPAGDP